MGFLISAIDFFKNLVVAKRKVVNGEDIKVNYAKIIRKAFGKYIAWAFIVLLLFGTILYSITFAVNEAWEYLTKLTNSTDINVIYDKLANMTEEERLAFEDTIAFVTPEKIMKYIDKERASVPSEIYATKTINDDGNISTEQISVDISALSSQYILPWQLIGAMDIITFNGINNDNTKVLDASNYAISQFNWATDTTRDETKYWKTWDVVTKVDPKKGTSVVSDGEDDAEEHFYQVKTPLGLLESVNTCFGLYQYEIKRDVVLVDEPYSARQLIDKELIKTEKVLDHTETVHNSDGTTSTKKHYRTVKYYRSTYTKTRNTLIEDQMVGPTFTFNPMKFIQFLNASEYEVDDLDLLQLCLESMPNTNNILDMIDRIIEGDYGDLDFDFDFDFGAIDGISSAGKIPLFHQWDTRWGGDPYGASGTIATSGCGPTSAAMVITGLQGDISKLDKNNDGICDPREAAAYSVSHGYRVEGVGTSWDYFADIGKTAGLNVRQYDVSQYKKVYEELKNGNVVIASMGPGHFTSQGHFIVLSHVLEDGKIKVNDPNKEICSTTPWDFESVIVAEARQFWAFDNPNRKSSDFIATGYTAAADECAGGLGITANGTQVIGKDLRHRYIAVDTNVIPMNTIVYIEVPANVRYQTMPDGTVVDMNGYYTAVDTGCAIKGNKIDIYFGTGAGYKELCFAFGRQTVQIYLK